jgi:3-isopropylmalate dehydrogenase
MNEKRIALVLGDGAAPEMMRVACAIAIQAALLDGLEIIFEQTPMGWNALKKFGDTLPKASLERILELGIVFFGGVGDPEIERRLEAGKAWLKPETRCLLTLRKLLGLLMNIRPVIYTEDFRALSRLGLGDLPPEGIRQIWLRYLWEDSYFGNEDLLKLVPPELAAQIGLKLKQDVNGDEERVVEFAYYSKANLLKYFRAAFKLARSLHLPVISVDKANIEARYAFWRIVIQRLHDAEFADVPLKHQLVDSTNAMLFTPELLQAVIVCGNKDGDTLTDGANGPIKLGRMYSSAVNLDTGAAMFESGAGTAADIAGQDRANPIGRIRTAGLMLEHIGAPKGAEAVEAAVLGALREGWRTRDLLTRNDDPRVLVGTAEMGEIVMKKLTA